MGSFTVYLFCEDDYDCPFFLLKRREVRFVMVVDHNARYGIGVSVNPKADNDDSSVRDDLFRNG